MSAATCWTRRLAVAVALLGILWSAPPVRAAQSENDRKEQEQRQREKKRAAWAAEAREEGEQAFKQGKFEAAMRSARYALLLEPGDKQAAELLRKATDAWWSRHRKKLAAIAGRERELAGQKLEEQKFAQAMEIAIELIYRDPADENARELVRTIADAWRAAIARQAVETPEGVALSDAQRAYAAKSGLHAFMTLRFARAAPEQHIRLVLIPPGTFTMGSPKAEPGRDNDEPLPTEVRIERPFYMGISEITCDQYRLVMPEDPERSVEGRDPVTNVSWPDAWRFCETLCQHLPPVPQIEHALIARCLQVAANPSPSYLTASEKPLYGKLVESMRVDLTDVPLPDALAFMREVRGLNIALHAPAPDGTLPGVTLKLNGPTAACLREILFPSGMGYLVMGNVIYVSTPQNILDRKLDLMTRRRLQTALEKPVEVDLQAAPLADALATLEKQCGIRIDLDPLAVPRDGAPVTLSAKGRSLDQVLQAMLAPLEMRHEVRDSRIYVSTAGRMPEPTPSESKKKMLKDLTRHIEVDFTSTPLPDVLSFLRAVRGMNIALDRQALPEDLAPVTLKLRDVPLSVALDVMLRRHGMDRVVDRDGILHVSSKADIAGRRAGIRAEEHLRTVLARPASLAPHAGSLAEVLAELDRRHAIQPLVAAAAGTKLWSEVKPPQGEFSLQSQLQQMLEPLGLSLRLSPGRLLLIAPMPDREAGEKNKKARIALEKLVDVDFTEAPLEDVIGFFCEIYNLPFKRHRSATGLDKVTTLRLKRIPLREFLDLVLEPHGLTWELREGTVHVIPVMQAGSPHTAVYWIDDILRVPGADPAARTRMLMRLIVREAAPGTWAASHVRGNPAPQPRKPTADGEDPEKAEIKESPTDAQGRIVLPNKTPRYFLIEQTPNAHEQIRALLASLRAAAARGEQVDLEQFTVGTGLRLPSEVQWEYACRAGTTTRFSFGDDAEQLGRYASFKGNSGGHAHRVLLKQPNPWGLHGMHGNVWEWCRDAYGEPLRNGGIIRTRRVVRGGCWALPPRYLRSANRLGLLPGTTSSAVGFRVVLEVRKPAD